MDSMEETAKKGGRSNFRGHPIIYCEGQWLYEDTMTPIPAGGGEARPCKRCGSDKWSGNGDHDECLGLLPGVDNACCGHGNRDEAYIRFTNGVVVRGFEVVSANVPK